MCWPCYRELHCLTAIRVHSYLLPCALQHYVPRRQLCENHPYGRMLLFETLRHAMRLLMPPPATLLRHCRLCRQYGPRRPGAQIHCVRRPAPLFHAPRLRRPYHAMLLLYGQMCARWPRHAATGPMRALQPAQLDPQTRPASTIMSSRQKMHRPARILSQQHFYKNPRSYDFS